MSGEKVVLSDEKKRTCTCLLLMLVSPLCVSILGTCYFTILFLQPEFQRLSKSFEFPAIEARAKPYSDLLLTATQDDLLAETQNIDHVVVSMTHPEDYTGLVSVIVRRIYGTNQPFESVQADVARFFSTKADWHIMPFRDINTSWQSEATYGGVCVFLEIAEQETVPSWRITPEPTPFPQSWKQYRTLYAIELHYLDRSESASNCSIGG